MRTGQFIAGIDVAPKQSVRCTFALASCVGFFGALIAVTACGPSAPTSGFGDGKTSSSSSSSSSGGFGGAAASGSSSGVTPNNASCTAAATFVYVVSEQNDLYRFDPGQLLFTKIGQLKCTGPGSPFSMAVDRTGVAWVDYTDGSLYRVSTVDATCEKTSYQATPAFTTFGMGFATDPNDATHDSLYVIGCDTQNDNEAGKGLGRIDVNTLALQQIGQLGSAEQGKCGELTGTGDGRLFGLFDGAPASIATIASSSSDTSAEKTMTGVTTQDAAYAFSFWGGDFWFYTAPDTQTEHHNSKVTRYKAASDGSIGDVVTDVGFTIVGAGVSTCAPTGPVK